MENQNILHRENQRASLIIEHSKRTILDRIKVRTLIGLMLRNNPIQFIRLDKNKALLNVGCGGNLLKQFINIDFGWSRNQDLCWNILKGIPLSDNSMEGIFIEHALEHFTMQEILDVLLPDFLRILKPGGILRISVPDAEKAVERYNQAKADGQLKVPFTPDESVSLTPMMFLNNTFRQLHAPLQFGHKFAFDYQTLEFFLRKSGFTEIRLEAYMCGRNEKLLVDYKRRAEESLYVEASKPLV